MTTPRYPLPDLITLPAADRIISCAAIHSIVAKTWLDLVIATTAPKMICLIATL
jgi:hypothetical protein